MQMVMALKPIHDAAGIERVIVSTYQSTSGTGQRAVEELHDQTQAVLEAHEVSATVYPHQIAFNILPQVETFKDGDDYTTEERKMMAETRKILGDESIPISATCVRVPVYNAHSESVNVQTREDLSPERCRELLDSFPGRDRGGRSRRRAAIRCRSTPPAVTTCSSAGSGATPRTSAASTCGSCRTTCARAPPRTPCSSPS